MLIVNRGRNRQIKTVIVPLPNGETAKITARQFLGASKSNPKLTKGMKYGWNIASLSLAPAKSSGVGNTCSHSTKVCEANCIFKSGHARIFPGINRGRIARTVLFYHAREVFLELLMQELHRHEAMANNEQRKLCVRLNVFSDIAWERLFPCIFETFPNVQFYDYTKIPVRAMEYALGKMPSNYHLTFSRSEKNWADCVMVLNAGGNVAVVFGHSRQAWAKCPQKWYMGTKVLNGELTDLRFLDGNRLNLRGKIIGLFAKGTMRKDNSGFVVRKK